VTEADQVSELVTIGSAERFNVEHTAVETPAGHPDVGRQIATRDALVVGHRRIA
jgi:hypothetical protein